MESLRNILPNDIIKYVINKYYLLYYSKRRINVKEIFNRNKIIMYELAYICKHIYIFADMLPNKNAADAHIIINLVLKKFIRITPIIRKLGYYDVCINNNFIKYYGNDSVYIYPAHDKEFLTVFFEENYMLPRGNNEIYCYKNKLYILADDILKIDIYILDEFSEKYNFETKIDTGETYMFQDFYSLYFSEKYIYFRKKDSTEKCIYIIVFSQETLKKVTNYKICSYNTIVIHNDLLFIEERNKIIVHNALTFEHLGLIKFIYNIKKFSVNDNVLLTFNENKRMIELFFLNH